MPSMKQFYQEYWRRREVEGRLHTKEDMWVPQRIKIAVAMASREGGPLSCIDVGCGEGTVGKLLRDALGKNLYIVGCDISGTALRNASSYYDEVFQIDFDSNGLWEMLYGRRFDKVICLETLEHLFKPKELLEDFTKILKKDGEIIVSFPNVAWYNYRIDLLRGRFPQYVLHNPGEHIQNFTLDSFKDLLEKTGFVPVELDGQFRFPRFCRPARVFVPLLSKFPSLFGYQLVVRGILANKNQGASNGNSSSMPVG
ncbi:class I SAM-dependent methyltransferase [Chloroflexota bacterium]